MTPIVRQLKPTLSQLDNGLLLVCFAHNDGSFFRKAPGETIRYLEIDILGDVRF
jgi:hypothetical protein